MINALVSGKVIVAPAERIAKSGKAFYTATIAAPNGGDDSTTVSVICFSDTAGQKLMALGKGDAVSLVGKITPKIYVDRNNQTKASLDMVADDCLTAYQVKKKRDQSAASTPGNTEAPDRPQSPHSDAPSHAGDDLHDDLPW